jgi:hypothetical protein
MKKEFAIINSNFGNFLINRYDLIGKHIEQTGNWELFLVEFYSKILHRYRKANSKSTFTRKNI